MRRVLSAALACLTAAVLVLAAVASWTSQTALDTPSFVARVGPVVEQQPVRTAIATEVADQLANLVGLPSAKPILEQRAAGFVDSPAFRPVWYEALTLAHQEVVAALTGPDAASVHPVGGEVYVDLIGVAGEILQRLPSSLETALGVKGGLQIPASGSPAHERTLISKYLGVPVPAGFATVPVMPVSTLDAARSGVALLTVSVRLLLLGALVLLVLALATARSRSLVLVQVGLWFAGFTAVAYIALRGVANVAADQLLGNTLRPAVAAVIQALFDSLTAPAVVLVGSGLVVAVVALLLGRRRA